MTYKILPSRRRASKRSRQSLVEDVRQAPGRVDREAGVIRSVKILGRESRNGKTYSDPALRDAAQLYEGISVNVDHPPRRRPGQERSVSDFFGVLENCKVRRDGVYGDLCYLKSHPLAESIVDRACRFPRSFGLSQNGEGMCRRDGGKTIVESVDHVRSVDIVSSPATNSGLFESEGPTKKDRKMATQTMTLEDALAALTAAVASELKGPDRGKALNELDRWQEKWVAAGGMTDDPGDDPELQESYPGDHEDFMESITADAGPRAWGGFFG